MFNAKGEYIDTAQVGKQKTKTLDVFKADIGFTICHLFSSPPPSVEDGTWSNALGRGWVNQQIEGIGPIERSEVLMFQFADFEAAQTLNTLNGWNEFKKKQFSQLVKMLNSFSSPTPDVEDEAAVRPLVCGI